MPSLVQPAGLACRPRRSLRSGDGLRCVGARPRRYGWRRLRERAHEGGEIASASRCASGPAAVAMASSQRSLYTRISGIGAFRPLPAWRGMLGMAVMLAALATVTTSCAAIAQPAAIQPPMVQSPAPGPQPPADSPKIEIKIDSKFISVTEEAWKKLCDENPAFKDFNSKLPELACKILLCRPQGQSDPAGERRMGNSSEGEFQQIMLFPARILRA